MSLAFRLVRSSLLDAFQFMAAIAVIVLDTLFPEPSCEIRTSATVPFGVLPFRNFAWSRICLV